MAGGGKGGRQTTEVKIPAWLEQAAQENIAKAKDIAAVGPVINRGPVAAAFTEPQQMAFQNTGNAAAAFGLAPQGIDMRYQPAGMDIGNGMMGYSAAPIFDQNMAAYRAANPGQFDFISGMFINPVTGALPSNPRFAEGMSGWQPAPAPVVAAVVAEDNGRGDSDGRPAGRRDNNDSIRAADGGFERAFGGWFG